MTWKELKDFCNSLGEDEKQLGNKVVLWREDEAINDIDVMKLEADYYKGVDDDGCYPLEEAGLTIFDVKQKGLKKVYEKGTIILLENF